jgi:hypothetical protein
MGGKLEPEPAEKTYPAPDFPEELLRNRLIGGQIISGVLVDGILWLFSHPSYGHEIPPDATVLITVGMNTQSRALVGRLASNSKPRREIKVKGANALIFIVRRWLRYPGAAAKITGPRMPIWAGMRWSR